MRHMRVCPALVVLAAAMSAATMAAGQPPADAVVHTGHIYADASFPSAHASTIVETERGLVAAWFGGTGEGHADVGIWLSRHDGAGWSAPVEVANGAESDGARYPCWNPVLVQAPSGPLLLFYKVGPSPRQWWGQVRTSSDGGLTWTESVRLPDGILGPIRAKPIVLPSGVLLAGSSTEHDGWVAHMERFEPARPGDWSLAALASPASWLRSDPLNDPGEFGAIQPTILIHSPTRIQVLCRSRENVITEAWSEDGGRSWSPMTATALPNPSAGIDALRLADGRYWLAYNPTTSGRRRLALAESTDGRMWRPLLTLEDAEGEFSYPALIQTRDGRVHVTYTWNRERIAHVVIRP